MKIKKLNQLYFGTVKITNKILTSFKTLASKKAATWSKSNNKPLQNLRSSRYHIE